MRESKDYLCYCGLYCKMCSIINGLPQAARSLHQIMQEDGWEGFGSFMYPEFGDFWKVLAELKEMDNTSPLCIGGCGNPACEIRICAQAKGLDICAFCDEYPCVKLRAFTDAYPFILKNNERIREIGISAWLVEQDELVARGVTHKSLK